VGWLVAVGCGGEADEIPATSADASTSDSPTGSPTDASAQKTDAAPIKDAAPPFDAASIDAPEVSVDYGTCADFTPCGGTVDGAYKMTGGCLSDSFLAKAKQQCQGLQESNVVITGKGTLDATATTITRALYAKITAKLLVPCTGLVNLIGGCPGVQSYLLQTDGITAATCTDHTGGGCDCDITGEQVNQGSASYTTSGNTISTDGDSYDYCVDGANLTLKPTNQALPITVEMAK
jgi:hypothetical protein